MWIFFKKRRNGIDKSVKQGNSASDDNVLKSDMLELANKLHARYLISDLLMSRIESELSKKLINN